MSRADSIRSRIDPKYEKTPGYLIYDVTQAVGQEMDDADLAITETNAKLNADNLTGEELDRFVKQRKGVERKAATYATGTVTVTGNGTVAAGDIFETENGVQFEATADVSVQESAEVPVQAKVAGNVGVVGAGTITQMPITIAGIVRCENAVATEDGYDAEADIALRERYYLALRTPTSSGNKTAYRNWALEVSGVGDAQVYPLGHGDGTVDVVIINDQMLPASTSLVVTFTDKGVPTDIDGLKAALEETKPAHIPIEYIFTYNTWADLKLKTWGELKTGTWAEAKVR